MPKYRDPRLRRLEKEYRLLEEFCDQSDLIDFVPFKQKRGFPPERYHITYRVKSIVGIDHNQVPIFGEKHVAEITIPPTFPLAKQPECKMITPVWHPNIKFDGEYAGRICINEGALGHWHTLDMLAERIGEMLQYKNYHAENTAPHPEDGRVALWVREFGEPRGVINKAKKVYTDSRNLLRPSPEWEASRKKKIQMTIGAVRKGNSNIDINKYINIASKRKKIRIVKRD